MSFNRFIIQERLAGQVIQPRATTLRLQLQPADGARSSERCRDGGDDCVHGARSSERRRDARRRYARRWLCPQGARSLDTLAACDPSTLTHSAVRLLHLLLRNPFNAFPGADASEAACETMEAVHAAQDEGMVDKLSVEGASSQPASNSCRHPSNARRSRPCARSAPRTDAGAICGWLRHCIVPLYRL